MFIKALLLSSGTEKNLSGVFKKKKNLLFTPLDHPFTSQTEAGQPQQDQQVVSLSVHL